MTTARPIQQPDRHAGFARACRSRLAWGLLSTVLVLGAFAAAEGIEVTPARLAAIEKEHGVGARRRVVSWQDLMQTDRSLPEKKKLELVNDFFNQMIFVDDIVHWKKKDYWATPLEFLTTNGGDCEDFSIAKYFTLRELGVPESRMRLAYVKALELNQSHMVLTYYETPNAEPLVLDNLDAEIKPASKRKDLFPVYSFNGEGLWLAKERGKGKRVGGSERLGLWKDLLARMKKEQVQ